RVQRLLLLDLGEETFGHIQLARRHSAERGPDERRVVGRLDYPEDRPPLLPTAQLHQAIETKIVPEIAIGLRGIVRELVQRPAELFVSHRLRRLNQRKDAESGVERLDIFRHTRSMVELTEGQQRAEMHIQHAKVSDTG